MPVKIETGGSATTLRNVNVDGVGVEKIGVNGSPVFLKGDGGAITTTTRSFGDLLETPFFTDYGVWDFELSLEGRSLGAGINKFDFTISVRIEMNGVEDVRTFSINISGNSLSNASVEIKSLKSGIFDIDGSGTADFTNEASVLNLTPVNEGNGLRMSFLGGSFEYPGFTYTPDIDWYNKNYPKYIVSVSDNMQGSEFTFTFHIANQKTELTH